MNLKLDVRLTVFLFSLICALPLWAYQIETDSSGRVIIPTFDSRGQLVSLTDGAGKKIYPDGSPVFITGTAKSRPSTSQQTSGVTIHVPADQPTIQAAINAASDGDTVLVADGTYKENINFNGKAIAVTSVNGPSTTTIDGGAVDSVVTFRTQETSSSVLNGFTITNGFSNFSKPNFGDGGGVFIGNASPVVTNNIITKNQACEGLGIFIDGGSALIQGNTISLNTAAGCSGGIGGGGIAILAPSTPQIIGNTIVNNIMTISGLNGGGLSLFAAGSPVIKSNVIDNNMLLGIAMVNGSTPQLIQNLITNNTGGGLSTSAGGTGMVLINNTFAENFGESSFIANFGTGSAISGSFPSDAVLQNNLIIGKEGQVALFCTFTLPAGFKSNNVFSSGASAFSGCGTPPTGSNGNISTDPLFVDVAVNDFHLQTGSPGVDTGDNNTPVTLPATDLDGNPRIVNTTVDLGVFEYQGTTTTSFSATSLTFSAQKVGTSSLSQTVTVNNTGSVALHITPFSATGDFSTTDTCHTSNGIAAGKSCNISVTFNPTVKGTRTGQIVVTSNDSASPVTIQLSGTATAPIVNLSVNSLSFSNQLVNTTSAAQQFMLSNIGDASLGLTSIIASGDFGQTNNCGASVAPAGSCTVNVTFAPTARGTRNGAVTIADDASGNPHSVTLQGTGIGPAATLSANSVPFTPQLVGTTSAAQPITLSNNGETSLAITSISTTGDFAQTNDCGNSVLSGQHCTIQITFKPAAHGTRNGTLSVVDNSTTSPEQASLTGMGTAPVASLSRTNVAFGNQLLNVPVTSPITVTNTGDAALSITSIGDTGDFSETDDCGASLPAQAHCTVTVKFQPSALGARIGTLTFTDSALDSPQSVSLTGTGVQLNFSTGNVAFGNQLVGTSSATQAVTVTNLGSSILNLSNIVASAGFTQTNTCGISLAANSSCIVNIAFAPAVAGAANGLITISFSGTQSTIILSGNGTDFTLGAQQGGSTSSTVAAGGTATYNLSMSGTAGASGNVNLSCSGAPPAATCGVNPTSVTLNGTSPAAFSVSVSTATRSSVFPITSPPGIGLFLLAAIVASAMALWASLRSGQKKLRYAGWAVIGFALLMFSGCGGGNMVSPQHGTPAGTFTLTVTATSGSASRNLNLTLTVN